MFRHPDGGVVIGKIRAHERDPGAVPAHLWFPDCVVDNVTPQCTATGTDGSNVQGPARLHGRSAPRHASRRKPPKPRCDCGPARCAARSCWRRRRRWRHRQHVVGRCATPRRRTVATVGPGLGLVTEWHEALRLEKLELQSAQLFPPATHIRAMPQCSNPLGAFRAMIGGPPAAQLASPAAELCQPSFPA